MENKIIIANHKNFIKYEDIKSYVLALDNYNLSKNIIICPSSLYLPFFLNKQYSVGLQNISNFSDKNLTGEISFSQIKNMNINYILIGHNDQRLYFNETYNIINHKINQSISNGLNVILCVGEKDKSDIQSIKNYLKYDITNCLKDIEKEDLSKIIIAYEPIWSIGTGDVAENNYINDITLYIKDFIKETYNYNIKVLYGGSINTNNINRLVNISQIDGFLIGEVSTKYEEFLNIIEVVVNQ